MKGKKNFVTLVYLNESYEWIVDINLKKFLTTYRRTDL